MNEEKDARLLSRAEFASLDGSASASRAERAAYRLQAAQEAWDALHATELAA